MFAAHGKSLQPILEKHGITLLCDVYSSRQDLTDESHRHGYRTALRAACRRKTHPGGVLPMRAMD
ncbi:MAG: hypothetical protein WDO73_04650 [Ignavibacteriota bacterium]